MWNNSFIKILLLVGCILNAYSIPVPETNDLSIGKERNQDEPDYKGFENEIDDMSLGDFLDYIEHQIPTDGKQSGDKEYEIILEYPKEEVDAGTDTIGLQKLLDNYEFFEVVSSPDEWITIYDSKTHKKDETKASEAQSKTKESAELADKFKRKKNSRSKRSLNYFDGRSKRKFVQFVDDPVPSPIQNNVKGREGVTNGDIVGFLDDSGYFNIIPNSKFLNPEAQRPMKTKNTRQGINSGDIVGILDDSGYFNIIPNSKFLNPEAQRPMKTENRAYQNYPLYPEYVEYPNYVTGPLSGDIDQEDEFDNIPNNRRKKQLNPPSDYEIEPENNGAQYVVASFPVQQDSQNSAGIAEFPIDMKELKKLESWRTSMDDPTNKDFRINSKFLKMPEKPNNEDDYEEYDDDDYEDYDLPQKPVTKTAARTDVLEIPDKPATTIPSKKVEQQKNTPFEVPVKPIPLETPISIKKPGDKKQDQTSKLPSALSKPKPKTPNLSSNKQGAQKTNDNKEIIKPSNKPTKPTSNANVPTVVVIPDMPNSSHKPKDPKLKPNKQKHKKPVKSFFPRNPLIIHGIDIAGSEARSTKRQSFNSPQKPITDQPKNQQKRLGHSMNRRGNISGTHLGRRNNVAPHYLGKSHYIPRYLQQRRGNIQRKHIYG